MTDAFDDSPPQKRPIKGLLVIVAMIVLTVSGIEAVLSAMFF